jgi:dTDP-4-dehydrorhamnose 3,5-epimerase
MLFYELPLAGPRLVELEPVLDHRGFNARTWCANDFAEQGLMAHIAQTNIIHSRCKGTLRGMHYQVPPVAEAKLFRVTSGSIYDVVVDVRPGSLTYMGWTSVELRDDSLAMLLVPEGFAQGFLTLEDDTEVTYAVSAPFSPDHGRGFRYDDPAFSIRWPRDVNVISERDETWPPFGEAR